jgi:transcriptional regulator with XRE-family HTH domain
MLVRKIDPKDLIEGVEAHKSQVSRWVTGRVVPSRATIIKLAEFFNCSIEWLATGKGEMFRSKLPSRPQEVSNLPGRNAPKEVPKDQIIRAYEKVAKLDSEFLLQVQAWLNDQEIIQPGFCTWFRFEFQRRFPEFIAWPKNLPETVE